MEHDLPLQWPQTKGEITGSWICNDGGHYYFSQFNQEIFWLGVSSNNTFCNIGVGKIDPMDGLIRAAWGDTFLSKHRIDGNIILSYDPVSDEISKVGTKTNGSAKGQFGGSLWKRK